MESLLLLRSHRDKHEWTRHVPSPSVRIDFEVAGNMFMRVFFTHVETPLLVWFVCISSVKIPLSRDSGLILRKYFLLASKLLIVY